MLVGFSFSNYKCFKDENSISLVAEQADSKGLYSVVTSFGYSVLKGAAVYGANASGKTKLFDAFNFFRRVVCPPRTSEKKAVPVFDYWRSQYDCFRLNTQSDGMPSFFEAVFILGNIQYRYGIEIDKDGIQEEWLYRKNRREKLILSRKRNGSGIPKTQIQKTYINAKIHANIVSADMLSAEVPMLTLLAIFNDTLSKELVDWFRSVKVISANALSAPVWALTDPDKKKEIIDFMRAFDFNIEDLAMHEIDPNGIPHKIRSIIGEEALKGTVYDGVSTFHRLYNELYERVGTKQLSMEVDESFGTNRLLRLSWPILRAIKDGTVLFIDEIDSGMHPYIIAAIVSMFYKTNNGAQLVVNTQNTAMLSYPMSSDKSEDIRNTLFRKDQIYVVNKNRYGESKVYPITYCQKNIRTNLEAMYLDGKLSGVPFIDIEALSNLTNDGSQEQK